MNTTKEQKDPNNIFKDEGPTKENGSAASLEAKLSQSEASRKKERFAWIVAAIILFDSFVFMHLPSWSGPIIIGIIEVIALAALGDHLEVKFFREICDKLINKWQG